MTTFPKDFLWSASTAATQIEGGWNADGKGESIWDTLVHDGTGKIAHGENADISIDFYHRWREDVALMKQMGLKAYRFSISWPLEEPCQPRLVCRVCGGRIQSPGGPGGVLAHLQRAPDVLWPGAGGRSSRTL